jgi:hypothetical protein
MNQYNPVCDAGNPDRKSLGKNGLNTFAALSISAYVCPSYSKIGSQPTISSVKLALDDNTQRVGEEERKKERKSLDLTKCRRPPRRHNLTQSPPLEDQWFLSRPVGEGERADCLGRFVLVGGKEVVEAHMAKGVEEPFSADGKEK